MSRKNRQAEIESRRRKVAANLLGGLNYRQMAEALGVSIGTIAGDVKVIIGRWQREQIQVVGQHQQLDLQRIERAINAIWDRSLAGELPAITLLIKLLERKAKMLGEDAAARPEQSGELVIRVVYADSKSGPTQAP